MGGVIPDRRPPTDCPYCGTKLDSRIGTEIGELALDGHGQIVNVSELEAKPGDFSLCASCDSICRFELIDGAIGLRRLTEQEEAEIDRGDYPDLSEVRRQWLAMKRAVSAIPEEGPFAGSELYERLPCGCEWGIKVVDGERTFLMRPHDLLCPHFRFATREARKNGQRIDYR